MSRKEAVRAFHAMRDELGRAEARANDYLAVNIQAVERAETAEGELEKLRALVVHLGDIVNIQMRDGNWNFNDYMRGMANGLLLAQVIMTETAVYEPLMPPDQWLEEAPAP